MTSTSELNEQLFDCSAGQTGKQVRSRFLQQNPVIEQIAIDRRADAETGNARRAQSLADGPEDFRFIADVVRLGFEIQDMHHRQE